MFDLRFEVLVVNIYSKSQIRISLETHDSEKEFSYLDLIMISNENHQFFPHFLKINRKMHFSCDATDGKKLTNHKRGGPN